MTAAARAKLAHVRLYDMRKICVPHAANGGNGRRVSGAKALDEWINLKLVLGQLVHELHGKRVGQDADVRHIRGRSGPLLK